MNNSITLGKRALTIAVAAATILYMVGASAFVAPLTAEAASAGDLVRGTTLNTLYYYASDGQRYAFPNEKTYLTWFEDFSGVQTLSDSELADIPLAGNIVYRPGARWIKIQSDPKTYAVTPQGQIRWIETEAVAEGLAGSDWNTFIDDVADVFFVDYTVGPSLVSAAGGYNGMLLNQGSDTYLVWDGMKRMVSAAGMSANRFQDRHVLPGGGVDLGNLSASADVTGAEGTLTDVAQLGESVSGGLSVSLASDTPASATIPGGAASVEFTKVKLQATSGSADVNQLMFKLGGVGTTANIDEAFLYEGNMRITDGRSINSSTREVTFGSLGISLGAGASTYVSVRADVTTTALGGDTANFGLQSESSVVSTASVSGSFPVTGNTMTFSDTDAGTIEIDKTGSISDPTIGEDDAVVGKFRVEIDDEDAFIHQITLNVDDAADHSDFKLWEGNDLLAACTDGGSDLVTCELTNPHFVEEGNSDTFKFSLDVGGENGDEIKVGIEENSDVLATGSDFGFNLNVDIGDGTPDDGDGYDATGGQCDASTDDCSFSTIEGGELTFAFNGPASDDIQIDGEDQVLMNFTITSQNFVEIDAVDVIVACDAASASGCDAAADDGDLINSTDTEANLQDITIRQSNGLAWMGPEELSTGGDDTTQTLEFDDTQNMNPGDSLDLMITVDVDNGATVDDIYLVTLDMSGVEAEDENGDDLPASDIIPTSDLVGNDFTLADASLDVNATNPPSDATYVKGSSNVPVVGFSWEAGDTSDINVTDVTFSSSADDDGEFTGDIDDDITVEDKVNSCSLYDDESGALIDGPESPDGAGDVEFDSFDWLIPAGETMKNTLKCNYANVDTDGGDDDAYLFFIDDGAAGDIIAEDQDGDEVTETVGTDNDDGAVTTIVITDTGTLEVSLDGSTPNSDIILGNSTGVEMATFKFDATDEAFLVEEVTLLNCVDDGGDALCNTFGSDDIANSVKIMYDNEAGEQQTKTGFFSSGRVLFDNLELFVPTDENPRLDVMIDTGAVSSQGADSGDQIGILLSSDTDEPAVTVTFEAIGASSGEKLDADDLAATTCGIEACTANDMTVRKTQPTISLAAGSPSGAGVPGFSEVFRFNVAADSRGFVTLQEITFGIVTSDTDNDFNDCTDLADEDLFEFYDLDDPSEKLDDDGGDWTFVDSDGDSDVDCDGGNVLRYAILDFEGVATHPAEEIGAGETVTYVLEIDTTLAEAADDDAIRVDIVDEDEADGVGDDVDDADAIEWDDDEESDDGDGDTDINGDLVDNLPVNGGTIQY